MTSWHGPVPGGPPTGSKRPFEPVRGLRHDVGARGAYKVYAGTAEVDARIRVYGGGQIASGDDAFVRIHTSSPLALDVFDRFVVREAGRQETVAGGRVLDVDPPGRAGPAPGERLASWARAERDALPGLLADERGAVRAARCCVAHRVRSPGRHRRRQLVRPSRPVRRGRTHRHRATPRPPRGPPAGGGRRGRPRPRRGEGGAARGSRAGRSRTRRCAHPGPRRP